MSEYIERYWRDAKPEDAIKEPPMVARFGNGKDMSSVSVLCGFRKAVSGQNIWYDNGGCLYTHCQVYDAPDPGEGWRLIDTASEKWQEGDEFQHDDHMWERSLNGRSSGFSERFFYRRRTTPAVTYVPFTWEDRDQLRGKKVLAKEPHRQVEFTCNVFQLNDDGSFFVDEFYSVWLCKNAVFVDTGKPVGKEVAQ